MPAECFSLVRYVTICFDLSYQNTDEGNRRDASCHFFTCRPQGRLPERIGPQRVDAFQGAVVGSAEVTQQADRHQRPCSPNESSTFTEAQDASDCSRHAAAAQATEHIGLRHTRSTGTGSSLWACSRQADPGNCRRQAREPGKQCAGIATSPILLTLLLPGRESRQAVAAVSAAFGNPCCIDLEVDGQGVVVLPEIAARTVSRETSSMEEVYDDLCRTVSQGHPRRRHHHSHKDCVPAVRAEEATRPLANWEYPPMPPTIPIGLARADMRRCPGARA